MICPPPSPIAFRSHHAGNFNTYVHIGGWCPVESDYMYFGAPPSSICEQEVYSVCRQTLIPSTHKEPEQLRRESQRVQGSRGRMKEEGAAAHLKSGIQLCQMVCQLFPLNRVEGQTLLARLEFIGFVFVTLPATPRICECGKLR